MARKFVFTRNKDGKELIYENALVVQSSKDLYVLRGNGSEEKKEILAKLTSADWNFYSEEALIPA